MIKANSVARIIQDLLKVCCPCVLVYLDTGLLLRQQKWWQALNMRVFSRVRARCGAGAVMVQVSWV